LNGLSELASALGMLLHFCPTLLFHFLALAIFRVETYVFMINVSHNQHRRHGRNYGPRDRSGETLRNFKAVRAYSQQSAAEEQYSKHLLFYAGRNKSPGLVHQLWIATDFFMQFIDNCITNIYSGSLVLRGVLGLTTLSEINDKGRSLVYKTWGLFQQLGIIKLPWSGRPISWVEAGAKLLVLFERKPPIALDEGKYDAAWLEKNGLEFEGRIEFKNVTFRYPPKSPGDSPEPIFENFNLLVPGGTKTGLVGPSGGGKTTALAVIQRFYDVEKGEVLLDGKPLKDWKPSFLATQIAVVQQESAIFDLTVEENVRWGKPDATIAEIENALKMAALWHDIDKKPLRMKTNAMQLSGGQKQRLTIARAIVRNPKILLLDEATAALDTKSEKEVQHALNSLMAENKGTCIAIAHRLSTIMDSDQIAVVKDKQIKECGTHAELCSKPNGEYAELSKLSGMSSDGDDVEGDEQALTEVLKVVKMELERDPHSVMLQSISDKLRAAAAHTNAERRRLKELTQTYEHALQEYHEHHDAAKMQAAVEQYKARSSWAAMAGVSLAKFKVIAKMPLAAARVGSSVSFVAVTASCARAFV